MATAFDIKILWTVFKDITTFLNGQADKKKGNVIQGHKAINTAFIKTYDLRLYTELSTLPTELKKEVLNFIEFLKTKAKKLNPKKQRKFGAAKGFLKCMMILMNL